MSTKIYYTFAVILISQPMNNVLIFSNGLFSFFQAFFFLKANRKTILRIKNHAVKREAFASGFNRVHEIIVETF